MILYKRIKKILADYLYDSSIYLKDRTFVLFLLCEMTALLAFSIIGLFLGDGIISVLLVSVSVAASLGIIAVFTKKGKLGTGKIILTFILVFILRPAAFFVKGGIHGGALVMFLLGGYFLVLVLDGKFRIFMCIADTAIYIVCGFVAYYHPEYVVHYSEREDYILSYANYLIALAVLTALVTFLSWILNKETKLAKEKTKELEELNKAQSRFFSSMSHEIRTPINTVLGLNEIILRQEDASEEIRKDARNIQGAGKMLLALINDILDVSKIEAGKMDIVPVNYSVPALLSEIVNMIWQKADEKGLEFKIDIDPGVPEMLYGDEVRIKQILINLLNNAVKYTKEGFVSLHMECEFPDKEYALLIINVSDSGMGIKPEALPHLFDTFQRVDEEKNRHIEGTGLGLSIVKQLVELMDGEIKVNSVYSQGSTFSVSLKQGITSEKRIGDISIGSSGSMTANEKFEHLLHAPNARILIVDDNEMNLQVEKKLLDGTDIAVDLSLSGADALEMTLKNHYDLIFMDHLMPEMDGIECYDQIREQKGGLNRDVPIVVLTANAGGENIELYNNTGFDGYLVKPVSGRHLEEMLINKLPAEKVITNAGSEMTGAQIRTASGYSRKKPVVIAASSMTDLPKSIIKELGIAIIPFTVITKEGVFWDNIDIDSDGLFRYMGDEYKFVSSAPPSVESLTKLFSELLQTAHHVIYITLTTGSSKDYEHCTAAAKAFENVTVINSEKLSSSAGILLMIAAKLARQNLPVDKIVAELEEAKKRIQCSFVIRSTEQMARRGNISPAMNSLLNTLWLRPVLKVRNDKMGVGRFLFGRDRQCYEKYIKDALSSKYKPDTDLAFITYAGMDEKDLEWIEEMVRDIVPFEHIIFQKASAGISSNCGPGTFGILYIEKGEKNYNLSSVLPKEILFANDVEELIEEDAYTADALVLQQEAVNEQAESLKQQEPEDRTQDSAAQGADVEDTGSDEKKWYEQIPGLDPKTAIKNSGSEDAFLSVIKIYYDSYDAKSSEIQGYYDSEDWKNYTIKVHALKSSSRLVGAKELGDGAEALEMAGKSEDIEYIRTHHEEVMSAYRSIINSLDDQFGTSSDLPEIPQDTLDEAYGALEEFTGANDYECVKMVLDSVKEFKLPEDDGERFKRIQDLLSQMDYDAIMTVLHERD